MIDQTFFNKLSSRLAEQESLLSEPSVASDQQKFRTLLKEHSRLKKLRDKTVALLKLRKDAEEHESLLVADDTDPDLKLLAEEELSTIREKLPKAERDLMLDLIPPDPNDSRNIIMELRAGTGGMEAALFAGDLARMYTRFAEIHGWKTEMIDARPSDVGGYKEIVFSIHGENAYRTLQYECGTHRVQRIPVTEASGRIHTSTATVAVLPEAEPTDDIEVKPEDLRVDVYRASGAGGQHVNKTDSAVRITHLPTGIVVACQEERSQHKNRATAMRVLRSRLLDATQKLAADEIDDARRSQIGSGERSERIRTYNFPQNRMTDHRIGFSSHNLEKIMEGELEALLTALHEHYAGERLKTRQAEAALEGSFL